MLQFCKEYFFRLCKERKCDMSKIPLYEVIYRAYKEKILTGELKPKDKLPTEMEIATTYNVSRITASRALKELELRKLIHRIKGSGSYVNDGDWNKETNTNRPEGHLSIISLVLPFEGNFSSEILQGIEDVAKEENYFVTFHNSSGDPGTEKELIEEIISRGSHGIIVYPSSSRENMHLYSSLLIDGYPFVLIDRKIPGMDMSLVWADNQKGFYNITSHLIELGHRRIIFAGTSVFGISSELERYNGFCKAHLDHGVPLMPKHFFAESEMRDLPSGYHPNEVLSRREAHYLFDTLDKLNEDTKPTAIASVNDQVAEILMAVALERGLEIPGDYSITGFDNLPFAAHLPVPLTTVAQPVRQIGQTAAQELFKTIQEPDHEPTINTIPAKMIIRASTERMR